tara:strand:- start:804 stop:1241 length:438 start_codon:yes stop_codon:yes gene_type:complete
MLTPFASPVVSPTKKKRGSPADSGELDIPDDVVADAQEQSPHIFLQSKQATPSLHTALEEKSARLLSAASLDKARQGRRVSLEERLKLGLTRMGELVQKNRDEMHAESYRSRFGKRKRVEEAEDDKGEKEKSLGVQRVEPTGHSI